ncbi:MAG: hypothetical protein V2A54_17395 [Bacteroidota bacterium]
MVQKKWQSFFLLMLSALFLFSCKKDPVQNSDTGYGYFPVNVGHAVVYDVDSTVWDDFQDSVFYFSAECRELIESSFIDGEGKESQRIERWGRMADTNAWAITDIWYSYRNSMNAQKVEENNRFIKLVFPVKTTARWNGNAMNSLGEVEYKYTDAFEPKSYNGLSFDSTITVLESADSNLVYKNLSYEVYAKGVGMIYREIFNIEYNTNPLDGSIKSGKRIIYKIKSYSN